MAGLPTLHVRETIHAQKIAEFERILHDLRPTTVVMKHYNGNIGEADIANINNDIDYLRTMQNYLKEKRLLHHIQQKIRIRRRERDRQNRLNNLTVNVEPPTYEQVVEEDLLDMQAEDQ